MKKHRDLQQEKGLYEGGWILLFIALVTAAAGRFWGIRFPVPPCIVHRWTGYYCPGCGGTRACIELFRGHFLKSFFYHPAVLYGAVLYVWFMVSHTIEYGLKGRFRIGMRYTDNYLYGAAAVILVQCVIKNVIKAVFGIGLA